MTKRKTAGKKQRQTVSDSQGHQGRTIAIVAAVVLGIGALGFLLYLNVREPESLDGLRRITGLSRGHDEQVNYVGQELPPVGGLHSGVWQNCGIYTDPIASENAVHSMEHGAVWITYHQDMPADDVAAIQEVVHGEPFVLLSPYQDLKSPVVLTAWGIQLEVDSANDGRIPDFIDRYQRGPQTPELGAPCTDGNGTPLN